MRLDVRERNVRGCHGGLGGGGRDGGGEEGGEQGRRADQWDCSHGGSSAGLGGAVAQGVAAATPSIAETSFYALISKEPYLSCP
ncbi:hypothetical protein Aau02nite_57850 [Amorphoplanes auranticolor]|uniref:Uncharacterized protein n=1 Tax=Actinoplanes auranticolor TaxID=47988 RepID=A0A919VS44_9ACTN|nr:hypothetical protein Aau02nite_57850 [Actinoplanes auranticolor]